MLAASLGQLPTFLTKLVLTVPPGCSVPLWTGWKAGAILLTSSLAVYKDLVFAKNF